VNISQVVAQVVNFVSNLIIEIMNIPIRNTLTFGDTIIIIIIIVMVLKFFKGRSGD